eukprot:Sspe_Gene.34243::Locus_16661_Transcript_1_1_Confidence_1.000_Length_1839::g.34243::m.34243
MVDVVWGDDRSAMWVPSAAFTPSTQREESSVGVKALRGEAIEEGAAAPLNYSGAENVLNTLEADAHVKLTRPVPQNTINSFKQKYSDVVMHPLDFATIRSKLIIKAYSCQAEFDLDLVRLFTNHMIFTNVLSDPIFKACRAALVQLPSTMLSQAAGAGVNEPYKPSPLVYRAAGKEVPPGVPRPPEALQRQQQAVMARVLMHDPQGLFRSPTHLPKGYTDVVPHVAFLDTVQEGVAQGLYPTYYDFVAELEAAMLGPLLWYPPGSDNQAAALRLLSYLTTPNPSPSPSPLCPPGTLAIAALRSADHLGLFHYPVPDGTTRRQMDLHTAEVKLLRGKYATPAAFADDLHLIFTNALASSKGDHSMILYATYLRDKVDGILAQCRIFTTVNSK